ncbi:fungal transcriptional regulatory protein [Ophiostoma piceae UAMH 11346]|uniref:Fungal transcriptional regulatory protein n=1 Tax=Ophiostoma piceae (strain UAMH 11346) TaxID=1262450 RepID=S3CRT3_OPHP1|nr:fungal transcriptional regulatory protein [Ophiostoma piceae UAMH 11346]
MAEGPIRRACNRCHTQKLSCKRVRNEPCERCVRLKAECKSSPSLRFRKPSNSNSGNNAGKSNNRHTTSSHREQQTSKRPSNIGLSHVADFPNVAVPYPGPYSFDGMAEHLWPAHSVDAGLLFYRPDGNQIYQTLPPSQIPFYDGPGSMLDNSYVTSPIDSSAVSYPLATLTPSTVFPISGPVSNPWVLADPELNTNWNVESCPGISTAHKIHEHHSGIELQSTAAPLMGTLLANHNFDSGHMSAVDKTVLPRTTGPPVFSVGESMQRAHISHDKSAVTISKALFSELCAVSTQLLELGNAVPLVYELPSMLPQPEPPVTSFHNSNDSRHRDGRLSARSSSSSFRDSFFPMDNLFTLSQHFVEALQSACSPTRNYSSSSRHEGMSDCPPFVSTTGSGTNATTGMASERVDAESFVVLANSTYTAFLDVYQNVLQLVHATAKSAQPPAPTSTNTVDGSYVTNDDMKHSLQNNQVISDGTVQWKEETAKTCLDVCRFPDVSVGGFSIVSTPALQLGLGLRLADDFLAHFSHAIALLHKCFSPTLGGNVATTLGNCLPAVGVVAPAPTTAGNSTAYLTQHSTQNSSQHPPLVFSESFYTNGGMDTSMSWDTVTATSVPSSSTTDLLFTPQESGLTGTEPVNDITARELQLRQELTLLRNSFSH